MIVSAAVIVAYTATGGFLAASTTDLVQSIVMTVALICIVLGFGIGAGRRHRQRGATTPRSHGRLPVPDPHL